MATYKGVVPDGKYTFNAVGKTITFDSDYTGIALSDIMLITNVKSGIAVTLYDPFDPAKGGTLAGLVLTLAAGTSTAGMTNSDPLQIIVGMVTLPTALPTGASTEATLSALNTKVPSNLTVTSTRLLVDGSGVTQPVSIAASVAVTGPLTDAQLRASAVPVSSAPTNSGGVTCGTSGRFGTQGGAAAILIHGFPCQVYGWYFYNPNSTVAYVHFYNASSITGITVGTFTPYYILPIPPVGGANVFGIGIAHSAGICIGVSQGRAVSTQTLLDIDYNIFYKS